MDPVTSVFSTSYQNVAQEFSVQCNRHVTQCNRKGRPQSYANRVVWTEVLGQLWTESNTYFIVFTICYCGRKFVTPVTGVGFVLWMCLRNPLEIKLLFYYTLWKYRTKCGYDPKDLTGKSNQRKKIHEQGNIQSFRRHRRVIHTVKFKMALFKRISKRANHHFHPLWEDELALFHSLLT